MGMPLATKKNKLFFTAALMTVFTCVSCRTTRSHKTDLSESNHSPSLQRDEFRQQGKDAIAQYGSVAGEPLDIDWRRSATIVDNSAVAKKGPVANFLLKSDNLP